MIDLIGSPRHESHVHDVWVVSMVEGVQKASYGFRLKKAIGVSAALSKLACVWPFMAAVWAQSAVQRLRPETLRR